MAFGTISESGFNNLVNNLGALGYLPRAVNGSAWRVNYQTAFIEITKGTTTYKYHLQFLLRPQANKNGIWDTNNRALIPVPGFDINTYTRSSADFAPTQTVKGSEVIALADKLKAAAYIPAYGYGMDGNTLNPAEPDPTYKKAGVKLLPVFDASGNAIPRANIGNYETYDLTPYLFGNAAIYDIKNDKLIPVDDAKLANPLLGQITNSEWYKNPLVIAAGVVITGLLIWGIYKFFSTDKK